MARGKNIDDFNVIVGLIFDQLYTEFPVTVDIDEKSIASSLGISTIDKTPSNFPDGAPRSFQYGSFQSGTPFTKLLYETLNWLRIEGLIHGEGAFCTQRVTLTSKALAVMNASPTSLEPSLGNRLSGAVSDVGKEGGRAAVSEVVGLILGGAIKAFSGSG